MSLDEYATETTEVDKPGAASTPEYAKEAVDVGIITSHMSFDEHGGANYSRHVVAETLESRGHDVTIYTLNFRDENHVPLSHEYDLKETRIDSRTIVDGVAKFYQQIAVYFDNHDVVHCYVPGIIPLVAMYKKAARDETPVVATLNGYTPFCTNTALMDEGCWKNCTYRDKIQHSRMEPAGSFSAGSVLRNTFNHTAGIPLMNRIDRYFCLSPSVARIYDDVGVKSELLNVVPNMVDDSFDSHDPIETDDVRILYVGRVDAQKGVERLLEALQFIDGVCDYHVDIVGSNVLDYGMTVEEHREYSEQLGIADDVNFHGWVEYTELSEYYARGDIFVHPGRWPEPFGRTIIEAMQHELPVVCSDIGAPPWVSGTAGLSYPKDDVKALADRLETLLADPQHRNRLRKNTAIELKRFDSDTVIRQIESTYLEELQT